MASRKGHSLRDIESRLARALDKPRKKTPSRDIWKKVTKKLSANHLHIEREKNGWWVIVNESYRSPSPQKPFKNLDSAIRWGKNYVTQHGGKLYWDEFDTQTGKRQEVVWTESRGGVRHPSRDSRKAPRKTEAKRKGAHWEGSFGYVWSPVNQAYLVVFSPTKNLKTASVIKVVRTKGEAEYIIAPSTTSRDFRKAPRRKVAKRAGARRRRS